MNLRSEAPGGVEWDNPPLTLPEAVETALERLSEAFLGSTTPTDELIRRLWEAEDAVTALTLDTTNTRKHGEEDR